MEATKGADLVASFDEFAGYVKGFLEGDAWSYVQSALSNDANDVSRLRKIAKLLEEGQQRIGKKLSRDEVKAGLDALCEDGGVEGALAAIERVFQGGFQYLNNPLDNPKGMRDVIKNPDAVFGYLPNPNSSSIGEFANAIDWSNPIEVEKVALRREAYHLKNDNISEIVVKMNSEGYSKEEIARAASKQRNINRLNDYINDPEGLVRVKKRNLIK